MAAGRRAAAAAEAAAAAAAEVEAAAVRGSAGPAGSGRRGWMSKCSQLNHNWSS